MSILLLLENSRRWLRDALPLSVGGCLTLRANPFLGIGFKWFRRSFHLDGLRFEVPLKGRKAASLATYWFNDYEAAEREMIAAFVKPDDHVCELGGCLGVVSMVINRRLSGKQKHVVVEANPLLIPFLKRNREINQGNFSIHHGAVGNGDPLELDFSGEVLTSARSGEPASGQSIAGCTLEDLCAEYGPFNVLVMDVEGAEKQVLLGEGEAWKNMRLIILEWHPGIIGEEAFRLGKDNLRKAGFTCLKSTPGAAHVVEAWEK